MKTILPAQMKALETEIMASGAVTGEVLMNRAAEALCNAIACRLERNGYALFACGCGNNGGDGFCAARKLLEKRKDVHVLILQLNGRPSTDCEREKKLLLNAFSGDTRLKFQTYSDDSVSVPESIDVVVDALFGTGLNSPLRGDALGLCLLINRLRDQGVCCVACDIPSGLDGAEGYVLGQAVCADETITFHRPKAGLYLREGPNYAGIVTVASIGLEQYQQDAEVDGLSVLQKEEAKALLPKRKAVSHKGTYGRVLMLCGSYGMAGAAALCANAALRTGAGLCTIAASTEIVPMLQVLAPCATCLPLRNNKESVSRLLKTAECCDAVVVGCGLGKNDDERKWAESLLRFCLENQIACVTDADGLSVLLDLRLHCSGDFSGSNLFLTPHAGEASRLLGWEIGHVLAEPVKALQALNEKFGAHVLLKGARSLMMNPERCMAVHPYGVPALAKGGSGDTLSGILSALLAGAHTECYAMNGLQAMQLACMLHEEAAAKAQQIFGERGLLATDVTAYLGRDDLLP